MGDEINDPMDMLPNYKTGHCCFMCIYGNMTNKKNVMICKAISGHNVRVNRNACCDLWQSDLSLNRWMLFNCGV